MHAWMLRVVAERGNKAAEAGQGSLVLFPSPLLLLRQRQRQRPEPKAHSRSPSYEGRRTPLSPSSLSTTCTSLFPHRHTHARAARRKSRRRGEREGTRRRRSLNPRRARRTRRDETWRGRGLSQDRRWRKIVASGPHAITGGTRPGAIIMVRVAQLLSVRRISLARYLRSLARRQGHGSQGGDGDGNDRRRLSNDAICALQVCGCETGEGEKEAGDLADVGTDPLQLS